MAGRPKEGIEFSGWATDVFEDPKIDKLIDGQGVAGFTIYFYLCQRAFGLHGYFLPWTCDDAASVARRIGGGVGSKAVQDTVGLCLRIGLFDRMLYEGHGVLTSRGIQRSFVPALKVCHSRLLALGSRRERRFGFHTQKRWVTSICVMQMPICGLRMTHRIG